MVCRVVVGCDVVFRPDYRRGTWGRRSSDPGRATERRRFSEALKQKPSDLDDSISALEAEVTELTQR